MTLECPHCRTASQQLRGDFHGEWVVCRVCERPFAWRLAARSDDHEPRVKTSPIVRKKKPATQQEEDR